MGKKRAQFNQTKRKEEMDRERITISIRKEVLHKIDKTIDGMNIRNRSHAVETLALRSIGEGADIKATVLLGGDKAMKLVPAAENFLLGLSAANIKQATIAVGFLGDKIREQIGDGANYNIGIKYSDKGEGSGGALRTLKKDLGSTFVVFNCSKKIEIDLTKAIAYHKSHKTLATVITSDLEAYEGIYIFEPEVFEFIPSGFSMIEEVLGKVFAAQKGIILPVISH